MDKNLADRALAVAGIEDGMIVMTGGLGAAACPS